jgi:anaerobic C4-dicarboxylate transporter
LVVIICSTLGMALVYLILTKRQTHFLHDYYFYAGWTALVTLASVVVMFTRHAKKYVWASRIIKAGMLGCLVIYLFLSL